MATRTPKKVSRRRAVLALGTGLVGSTVAASATGQKGAAAAPLKLKGKSCKFSSMVGTVAGTNGGTRKQLQTSGCCGDLSYVLNEGYKSAPEPVKSDMADFIEQMNKEQSSRDLLDFCYVQFDLTQKQLDMLTNFVKENIR